MATTNEIHVMNGHGRGDRAMRTQSNRSRRNASAPRPVLGALLLGVAFAGCDFIDPTRVENPRTTTDDLAGAANPTASFVAGMRAQFARMIGSTVVITEITSDNYSVHGTGLPDAPDNPRDITAGDMNFTSFTLGMYWNTQELRALADFVLNEIVPGDATATDAHVAEIHFYRGMAYLLQGENFSAVPTERDGVARPASELLQRAVTDFGTSIDLAGSGVFALRSRAALARAHRMLGAATEAATAAQQVLAADANFVYQQQFDPTSIENQPHIYLVVRALREMQPLPRLDFLDPKYTSRSAGIAVAKAEEMHLILAEIALANGNMPQARQHTADAVSRALSRAVTTFADEDQRLNADLTIRPRSASILVRASPDSPFRAGLVLTRPGTIPVPVVSGTSLDADSVLALTTDDETWHAFHLARQEILFLEGRRMSDLGIRLPMMQREVDQNANIESGDPGTTVVVPAYIPPGSELNLFDPASPYDLEGNLLTTEVTILHDLNRILADNRVNRF